MIPGFRQHLKRFQKRSAGKGSPGCLALALLSLFILVGCAGYLEQASREAWQSDPEPAYALVGAHLITMKADGLSPDQTLIVRQGRIVAMGPVAEVPIPADVEVLDMRGKYVLPGFADMHVHLAEENDLLQFLRHGVTTVRNMADYPWWGKLLGYADAINLREKVRQRRLIGPNIFSCGRMLDGDPPRNLLGQVITNREQALQAVKDTVDGGFDCVKVYSHLKRPQFDDIVAAARTARIPVVGHVPYDVGLEGVLAARLRSIEHLNAYIDFRASAFRFPEAELAEAARRTTAAGVYNCPTLVIWDHFPPDEHLERMAQDPRYRYLSLPLRLFWPLAIAKLYDFSYPDKDSYAAHTLELSLKMTRILYEQGSPLLLGTDANLTGIYPGSTLLREMELFARAGIPNQAILAAASLNAARALGRDAESGSLAVGKRADLVVLDADPLQDIRNVRAIHGVLVQGRWLDQKRLGQMLAAAYGSGQ
ncbi:MAG: amidohydrolase family protein [Candidatus Sericytochromatia bacterium]